MVTAAFDLRQHPKWMRGPARVDGDEIVLEDKAAEIYLIDELEHRQRLLVDLIDLRDCDPQGAVTFLRRRGLLWHGPKDLGSGECRESLADWRGDVRHLWVTVGLYLTLKVADEVGRAKPARDYLRNLRALNIFGGLIPDNDRECLEAVSVLLAERITRGMEGCSWTLVAACTLAREGVKEGGPHDFLFGEDPPNLVAAAYAQLASLIVNKIPFKQCAGCGSVFTPKHGRQRYCGKRCSERTRKARQRAKGIKGV
jgi:predicted nucleic acid-binding Zn ribbon protein